MLGTPRACLSWVHNGVRRERNSQTTLKYRPKEGGNPAWERRARGLALRVGFPEEVAFQLLSHSAPF